MTSQGRPPSEPSRGTGGTPSSTPSMADRVQDAAGRMVGKAQETASRVMGQIQEATAPAVGQVQETVAPAMDRADEARGQVMEQATEQVTSQLDMAVDYAAESLTGVARALRQTGQHLREEGAQPMLGQYADAGAQQLERFGGYLRQRDADELIAQVEWHARRNPAPFAAGAFALGLLAARFFRSSGQRAQARAAQRAQARAARSQPSYGTASPTTRPLPRIDAASSTSTGGGVAGTPVREAERRTPHPGGLPATGAPGQAGAAPTTGTGGSSTTPTPGRGAITGGSVPGSEGPGRGPQA